MASLENPRCFNTQEIAVLASFNDAINSCFPTAVAKYPLGAVGEAVLELSDVEADEDDGLVVVVDDFLDLVGFLEVVVVVVVDTP